MAAPVRRGLGSLMVRTTRCPWPDPRGERMAVSPWEAGFGTFQLLVNRFPLNPVVIFICLVWLDS